MSTSRLVAAFVFVLTLSAFAGEPLKCGIIGADTSHVPAFTKVLNNPKAEGDVAGIKVIACFPGGSPDIPDSINRVPKFVETLKGMNVEIVDSVEALVSKVDVVLLESLDGRPKLQQILPALKAKKPVFVDKPLGGSLADIVEIFRVAKENNAPIFSSSSLRYTPGIMNMKTDPKVGTILGCDAFGPCSLESHHPDLFWYGIHGVEVLYTIMGPGCESVTRVTTKDTDVVVGIWKDGRVGTFRGTRTGKHDYGATVFGSKGTVPTVGFGGYEPLVVEIAKFFKSGTSPVAAEETLELYAFMEAADESKRQGGKSIKIVDVIASAQTKKPN